MHDLRRKVLQESGKTVSRKARSRPESARTSTKNSPNISPSHSQRTSPAHSRAGSRYASEAEMSDDEYDDTMTASTLSNGSDSGLDEAAEASWATSLQDCIVQLQDRKRHTKDREEALMSYLHIVKHHYAGQQISGSLSDITSALMKNIGSGRGSVERIFSLKSLQATLLTAPSDDLFEELYPQLERACEDDDDNDVKAAAVWAMAITALYGGGSEEAADEYLDFLVGIVESDGQSVSAPDSAEVVTAALEAWAFVASQMDITENVYQAIEAFVEQLDSTDADVQTSAGFNIAFIFEAARDQEEETGEPMNLQYDPKRLISRMAEASKPSVKQTSRKDRRHLRKQFASIVTSLEHGKGPRFSGASRPAFNPHTGGTKAERGRGDNDTQFGYREKLRIGSSIVVIDSWSLMARVNAVRTVLGGGMPAHFNDNPTVSELLGGAETEESSAQVYALHPRSAKKMRR